jgi:hypothetical protein
LCSPFCSDGSWLHQPSDGSASDGGSYITLSPCGRLSTSCLGLPCTQGTSTLSLAAVAISALLAGSMPAIPSARADIVLMTGNAPPHSCTSMHGCSTSLAPTFSGMPEDDGGLCCIMCARMTRGTTLCVQEEDEGHHTVCVRGQQGAPHYVGARVRQGVPYHGARVR